jgi:hypothetical protein
MNAVQKLSVRILLFALAMVVICFAGPAGCVHKPSLQEYEKVQTDPTLTPAERSAKLVAMTPDPDAQYYILSASSGGIGIVLLVVGLIAKKRLEQGGLSAEKVGGRKPSSASVSSSHYSAASPKPASSPRPGPTHAPVGPPASYLEQIKKQEEAVVKKLPESQGEAQAIPPARRSMSFFTSRPLAVEDAREVNVRIGYTQCAVMASEKESEQIALGQVPRIRAFTIHGETIPWYEWDRYDPYRHYWPMDAAGWAAQKGVIPCFLHAENLDPALRGYHIKKTQVMQSA